MIFAPALAISLAIVTSGLRPEDNVWKNVRTEDYAAQFNSVAEPFWLERCAASSVVCAPGFAIYRSAYWQDTDSHENDVVLDQIMSGKMTDGLSVTDSDLVLQGIEALLGFGGDSEPRFHARDMTRIALLSQKLASFRSKPKGVPLRSQVISTAVSLRLWAEVDPGAAVPALVNSSKWGTPVSPVIGQNCIILAVQLERKLGKKKEAHQLWQDGRSRFLPGNPTGLAGVWKSED